MAKVLCVEDEELIRDLVVFELEDAGHEVVEAGNGKEALSKIAEERPDLILSDWLMPEMSGPELLTAVKADPATYGTAPFVLVSAYADSMSEEEGRKLGATAYLSKPVDYDVLLDTVAKLAAERAQEEDDPQAAVA